jgi:sulfane dehydrogenase subunit SoxC
MREVGVQKGATWLIGEGAEWKKHAASIPLERAMEDGFIAYAQNGEAIRPEQGYPLRVVLPGVEVMRNIRWLRRLYVTDRPVHNEWEARTYVMLRPGDGKARWHAWDMEPNSVITYPSGEQQLRGPGMLNVTGLAWTGTGSVAKVQVSTDGARTWQDAALQTPVLPKAHTRFQFIWRWDGGPTVILSRCIDEWGNVQPTRVETEKMWNVGPDYFTTSDNVFPHYYACQPWRIAADGKVTNAMWE